MRPQGGVAFPWRRSRRVRLLVRRADRMRLSVRQQAQNALFRYVAAPRRCGATPPARLRGTMENASTGQMRSSNPPPACGAGCAGTRRSRFGVWPHGKAQCAWLPAHRVRFLVRRADRMRLSVGRRRVCPGEEKRTLRKTALCASDISERRTLGESPSRKGAFWLRALGGGAFPPVVFEHVTESSTTVRAEWDDRLPAQVHRSQKSCGKEAGLNLKAKDPPEANAPIGGPCLSRRAWT